MNVFLSIFAKVGCTYAVPSAGRAAATSNSAHRLTAPSPGFDQSSNKETRSVPRPAFPPRATTWAQERRSGEAKNEI